VFLDDNANGRLDPGEKALAGVAVSDGVAWAITDANGRYAIEPRLPVLVPAGTDPILTVSFPSGTWPVGAWYRRAGAKAADGVDFPLRKDAQKLPFTFVHATDPHVPRGGLALFRGFRAEMEALARRPPFCILTGDCANVPNVRPPEAARSEFTLFAQQARGFPFPLLCIPGNHDAAGLECLVGWDRKSRWSAPRGGRSITPACTSWGWTGFARARPAGRGASATRRSSGWRRTFATCPRARESCCSYTFRRGPRSSTSSCAATP
jgi:hypothetical protein